MRFRLFSAAALLCGLGAAQAAHAEDLLLQQSSIFNPIDEVRLGGGFHSMYGALFPIYLDLFSFDRPEVVTFDVLFSSPDLDAFRWIGSPRPEIGATISLGGYESILHLGLTWQVQVLESPFFLQGTLGGALNNGYLSGGPPGYRRMGCNYGFYESVGVGADLPGDLTVTVTYEHTSNWSLCAYNDGLSNLKLQMGMKF
jgi:lipid A 3-O-deacylase